MKTFKDFLQESSIFQKELKFTFNRDMQREREILKEFEKAFPEYLDEICSKGNESLMVYILHSFKDNFDDLNSEEDKKTKKAMETKMFEIASKFPEFLGTITEYYNMNYLDVKYFQFATVKVKNLKFAYHITTKNNLENILKNGLKIQNVDNNKWTRRNYKNAIFFGYPLDGILNFMNFKGDLVAIKVDLSNLPIYFDAGFDTDENTYKDNINSFVCFQNIEKERILDYEFLESNLKDLKINDEIAKNLMNTILKNSKFWNGYFTLFISELHSKKTTSFVESIRLMPEDDKTLLVHLKHKGDLTENWDEILLVVHTFGKVKNNNLEFYKVNSYLCKDLKGWRAFKPIYINRNDYDDL